MPHQDCKIERISLSFIFCNNCVTKNHRFIVKRLKYYKIHTHIRMLPEVIRDIAKIFYVYSGASCFNVKNIEDMGLKHNLIPTMRKCGWIAEYSPPIVEKNEKTGKRRVIQDWIFTPKAFIEIEETEQEMRDKFPEVFVE